MMTATLPAHMAAYSFSEWRPGTTTQSIGKCRQCKRTVRVGITQMKQLFDHPVKGPVFLYDYATTRPCVQHKDPRGLRWSTTCPTEDCCFPRSQMPSQIDLKRIDGVVNEKTKCDPRCTGATGHTCECQCGGENHGADHSI
jgi:hypothetical protein